MRDDELLQRISIDREVMMGKPVVRGTRLTVDFIVGLLGHGASEDEILGEYPGLTVDDLHACLLFSSRLVRDVSFAPLTGVAD